MAGRQAQPGEAVPQQHGRGVLVVSCGTPAARSAPAPAAAVALQPPAKPVRKVRKCGNPASMRVCSRLAVREAVREVRKARRLKVRLAPPAFGLRAPDAMIASTSGTAPAILADNSLPARREDDPATAPHPGPAGHSSKSPRIEDRTRYTVHFSAPGGDALQPKCLPSVCRCPRSFSSRSAARSL